MSIAANGRQCKAPDPGRRILYTPKARFALDSLGGGKQKVILRLSRLLSAGPTTAAGAKRISSPRPLYVMPVAPSLRVFFRPLPTGAVEVVDVISKVAADAATALEHPK